MVLRKLLELEGVKYYKKHLEIIEVFLPIKFTGKEKDLLSYVMYNTDDYIIKKSVRDAFRKKYGWTSQMLYNVTTALVKKKVLIREEERLIIVPTIIPNKKSQRYEFFIALTRK